MINVYQSRESNFNNNGLAVLNECLTCFIKEELNGMYDLELEYAIQSKKIQYLKKWNILKAEGQLFRIYNTELNDTGKKILKVWARHISYDLAFFFIEHIIFHPGSSIQNILDAIKQGTPFSINTDIKYNFNFPIEFKEIDRIEGLFKLIQLYGGDLKRDNFNLSLNHRIGNDNGVLISYGKNLQGITETINTDNAVTRIYPIGSDNIRLPEKYIDSDLINNPEYPPYPIIKKVNFDAYSEQSLRTLAKKYINDAEKPKLTYEVDFIELEKALEYKNYKHLENVKLGDVVIVRHTRLGIDIKLKVLSYEKDVLRGIKSKIILGSAKDNFIDLQLSLVKTKETVDNAFDEGKLNSDALRGIKVVNEETGKTTFEVTENGDTFIDGKVTIGPQSIFEQDYDPSDKANKDDLGEMAFEDAVEKSKLGQTIIEGGYLKTGFVDASRIDTGTLNANQINIEAKDPQNNTVIKLGRITDSEEPAKYGLRIKGDNGELMIDEYGIDPRFIKAFKNMIWNSSFERFDPVSKVPHYWSGGESTSNSSFDNTHSMKLDIGQMSEQSPSNAGHNSRPVPSWWGNERTRISFFKKGGDVQVQVFSEYDFSPFALKRESGETLFYYNTGYSNNWDDGRYTFSFIPNKPGKVWIRFSNIGGGAAYIDAVQLEPDFNGKYPSFYTNGPYSGSVRNMLFVL